MTKLSIVTTLYRSAKEITEFHRQTTVAAQQFAGADYELVFVNDGSPDNSYDIVHTIAQHDAHVVLIDLSRNFGQHKALMTGLAHARGEYVMMLDSDLEEDPQWLHQFYSVMQTERHDVVIGIQKSRKGGWFERWSGMLFYLTFNLLAGFSIPTNTVTARLMTRRFVDALLLHNESELFLGGISYITGFSQGFWTITKHSTSETSYTLRRKLAMVLNSVTAFSNVPLYVISYVGMSLFAVAAVIIIYLIYMRLTQDRVIDGWASLLVAILALGGLQMSAIGMIGLYIAKIFIETKRRPFTIIRSIYHKES